MAKKKETTPEEKLRALYSLQIIDSRIDRIREVRGELPLEVEDLEDEIAGLDNRLGKINDEIDDLKKLIQDRKTSIEESKMMIKKYEEQQGKVRNNREYDSLTKEIEFQALEIELSEKRIKENQFRIDSKQEVFNVSKAVIDEKKETLSIKQSELEEISSETRKEEELLTEQSEKAANKVDDRLLRTYKRLRGAAINGLAVVPVDRGASAGSFIQIPPQAQIDIASRKKVIVDEHSGRILVDSALAEEEKTKMEKVIAKILK
ncbi:MAG: putative nucleic acid-binding Zn-ribbon protein [Parvicella sp.]|jgi:predicted  nucleic acid-binding Zn-ribbon protein